MMSHKYPLKHFVIWLDNKFSTRNCQFIDVKNCKYRVVEARCISMQCIDRFTLLFYFCSRCTSDSIDIALCALRLHYNKKLKKRTVDHAYILAAVLILARFVPCDVDVELVLLDVLVPYKSCIILFIISRNFDSVGIVGFCHSI